MMKLIALFVAILCVSFGFGSTNAFCFGESKESWQRFFVNDNWLNFYEVIRVVNSDLHYLPSYLAATGGKYGRVEGNVTFRTHWRKRAPWCDPAAMSVAGVFKLENPPASFLQDDRRFSAHLHEGTCDEINKQNLIIDGVGNHYQHIPVCKAYSYSGFSGYSNNTKCRTHKAPGGEKWDKPLFELWPEFYPTGSGVYKVGALGKKGPYLTDCPTPCDEDRCTKCQGRAVPWWPVPGTAVSLVVHDTAAAANGAGPIMLCAELTGRSVETAACEAAGIEGCKVSPPKESKFCLSNTDPFLPANSLNPCASSSTL